jgi:hypothetical protein
MPQLVFDESEIIIRKTIYPNDITDNQRKYGRLQVGKEILSKIDKNTIIEIIIRK